MRHRCSCKGMHNYKDYGGRGISVCDEWERSFETFYEWAMQNGYSDELTIDRIDVNGNYEPSNCRWADKGLQSANRRSSGKCEYIGVFMHSNGSCYMCSIKQNGIVIFTYSSRSKNDCVEKRNEFIIKNNLSYPLNEIKSCYENVLRHKNDYVYSATDRDNGERADASSAKELASIIGITPQFICQCLSGTRNSKKYIFEKRCLYCE